MLDGGSDVAGAARLVDTPSPRAPFAPNLCAGTTRLTITTGNITPPFHPPVLATSRLEVSPRLQQHHSLLLGIWSALTYAPVVRWLVSNKKTVTANKPVGAGTPAR